VRSGALDRVSEILRVPGALKRWIVNASLLMAGSSNQQILL
jgi:hypothetical protein